jgi:hypothetical protein
MRYFVVVALLVLLFSMGTAQAQAQFWYDSDCVSSGSRYNSGTVCRGSSLSEAALREQYGPGTTYRRWDGSRATYYPNLLSSLGPCTPPPTLRDPWTPWAPGMTREPF